MRDRRLRAEEAALWARVAATVTPLDPTAAPPTTTAAVPPAAPMVPRSPPHPAQPPARPPRRPVPPSDTLDGGWDRRLRRGVVLPERSLDLHGHTLATAEATLEAALNRAVADGVRVLLVVTGKPPRHGSDARRGLIRARIFDWLARSAQAGRIAAVRNAHPRHGGLGALYLILRRTRGE